MRTLCKGRYVVGTLAHCSITPWQGGGWGGIFSGNLSMLLEIPFDLKSGNAHGNKQIQCMLPKNM